MCNPVPGEMGGATSAGPPSPSAGGEEQQEEGSGKFVGLAGSGKKASFLGRTGWWDHRLWTHWNKAQNKASILKPNPWGHRAVRQPTKDLATLLGKPCTSPGLQPDPLLANTDCLGSQDLDGVKFSVLQTALLSLLPEVHFCVVHSFAPDAVQSLVGDTAKEEGELLLVPSVGTTLEQLELQDVRSEGSYWK